MPALAIPPRDVYGSGPSSGSLSQRAMIPSSIQRRRSPPASTGSSNASQTAANGSPAARRSSAAISPASMTHWETMKAPRQTRSAEGRAPEAECSGLRDERRLRVRPEPVHRPVEDDARAGGNEREAERGPSGRGDAAELVGRQRHGTGAVEDV